MPIGSIVLPSETFDICSGGPFFCFGQWLFDVTAGFFWVGALLSFCIIAWIALINVFGNTRSYGFASIIGLFGSIWFATLTWMPWWIATLFILNGIIGFIAMINSER